MSSFDATARAAAQTMRVQTIRAMLAFNPKPWRQQRPRPSSPGRDGARGGRSDASGGRDQAAPLPPAAPTSYVMQPFNVKLDCRRVTGGLTTPHWRTRRSGLPRMPRSPSWATNPKASRQTNFRRCSDSTSLPRGAHPRVTIRSSRSTNRPGRADDPPDANRDPHRFRPTYERHR
jgi:hypothetical protein